MTRREWLLSALFVAFVALKVVEGVLAVESWPLSHVPMFAHYQPLDRSPVTFTIHARRRDAWLVLQPWQLGLNHAELNRQLLRDDDPGLPCGTLLSAFNARRPRSLHFAEAYVERRTHARPHTGASDLVERFTCPLATMEARGALARRPAGSARARSRRGAGTGSRRRRSPTSRSRASCWR